MVAGDQFRRVVWPLAVAETLLWAGFYYMFPALLGVWERDFPWSKVEIAGALTASLLASALLAPVAGRLIDHGHGRTQFVASALLGAAMLVLLSRVTELWEFYAVWTGLGIAMAGCLYEPCFAVLTRIMGDRARQAITIVTLVAGFAGTVCFPTVHTLEAVIGWRNVVLVFAALAAFVCVPLLLFGLAHHGPDTQAPVEPAAENTGKPFRPTRSWVFWFLGLSYAMMALNHFSVISHMLPMLAERGVGADTAVLAASMIGPMQVAGRLCVIAVQRHVTSTPPIAAVSLLAMATASAALLGAHAVPGLLVVFVLCQGAGNGVMSITRPVIVAELLGRRRYGAIAGMLAVPYIGFSALAPGLAGLVWVAAGYDGVLVMTLAAGLLGAAALMTAAAVKARERHK
ncbi:MAG: MFS transporter [Rhodospirillales bacterium CG15_BIG_FIL_POST_REV_8_21_14_020_66_15]|nr:MAG: MFS transporter [Rhodospirillales bacterium CG15_BIG_FIL_POST_REV_8_21_14_020_66_15]